MLTQGVLILSPKLTVGRPSGDSAFLSGIIGGATSQGNADSSGILLVHFD